MDALEDGSVLPGRVAVRHKDQYLVLTEQGEAVARIKKQLIHEAESLAELPVVGDWVALKRRHEDEDWRVVRCLPRRTRLSRKRKGTNSEEQILAANVTTVFIVMGLDEDFNLRRLERFLVVAHESGAQPVVVLNKEDLLADEATLIADARATVEETAGGTPVFITSAIEETGLEELRDYFASGTTSVLVGTSGAGKSTLINALFGEERQLTAEKSETTGRGRHTTSQRELLILPDGGVVIDSPGVREVQLWASEEEAGLEETFAEIEELAAQCRFSDCSHGEEPGCAVRAAIEAGELDEARLASYQALQREKDETARRLQLIRDYEGRRRGRSMEAPRRSGKRGRRG